jgi:hypothetical protein
VSRPLLAIVILGLVVAPPSWADASSSIAVQPAASALDLVMDGAGSVSTHIVRIAVVVVASDGPRGFTLSIGSGSLGKTRTMFVRRDGEPAPRAAWGSTLPTLLLCVILQVDGER